MTDLVADKLISDGIVDQHGRKWLRFGTGDVAVWIATSELHVLNGQTLSNRLLKKVTRRR